MRTLFVFIVLTIFAQANIAQENSENQLQEVNYTTSDGKEAEALMIFNPQKTFDWVFVIHEKWGLNDQIKNQTLKIYEDLGNVNIATLDLYDGKATDDSKEASGLVRNADDKRIKAIIQGAVRLVGSDARIISLGYGYGASWSLQTALMGGEQIVGCVMYYGKPENDVEQLKKLNTDVLGIFAEQDKDIKEDDIEKFQENMTKAGKQLKLETYDADDAFANPNSENYNQKHAEDAYNKTLNYLKGKF